MKGLFSFQLFCGFISVTGHKIDSLGVSGFVADSSQSILGAQRFNCVENLGKPRVWVNAAEFQKVQASPVLFH